MQKIKIVIILFLVFGLILLTESCKKTDGLIPIENQIELLPKISDYHIFQGKASELIPTNEFKLYELSTQLFTDYAEKQRLIKVPKGTVISVLDDGLPNFPDGTILVKTFFYYLDKANISAGKNIIETRILIKEAGTWNVGTYLWNAEQTEATLITTGLNKTINWIDENGKGKVISYHIPNHNECTSCHQSQKSIIPIGPKIRNWNIDVVRNGQSINQLSYFQDSLILNPINPASFSVLPNWKNTSNSLEERARAYLEVNCAHCHTKDGFASKTNIYFNYEIPLHETKIEQIKDGIADNISKGNMPKLGTTIVDQEGLEMMKNYINTLK